MFVPGITAGGFARTLVSIPGRGSVSERSNYIGSLSTNITWQWLFEGGTDPDYRDGTDFEGFFDQVATQIRFDGADASTTITNESSFTQTWVVFGNAQIDTAQSQFAGGSSLLLDGTGDYVWESDTPEMDLGSSEWTIEFAVRFNGDPGTSNMTLVAMWGAATNRNWEIALRNNQLVGNYTVDSTTPISMFSEAWNPAGDTWYHIAVTRDNSATDIVRVFVDGTQLGSGDTTIDGDTISFTSDYMYIGAKEEGGDSEFVNGWIDNFRMTVGVARYVSNFTAPTEEWARPAARLSKSGGNTIDPTFSGPQLGYASVDSITYNHGVDEGDVAANDMGTVNYAYELWYQQDDYTAHGFVQGSGDGILPMIGFSNNNTRYLGGYYNIIANGTKTYFFPASGRTGADSWESVVDTYGDNTPHQLMEIHEVGTRNNYIVLLDGVPIASGTDSNNPLIAWDGTAGVSFNGNPALPDTSRLGTTFGSMTFWDNGEEWTIQKVRELFERTALDGHDMLTAPIWIIEDSENVTINAYTYNIATMGDVLNSTGIRSGAIPRTGKIYFEFEVIAQGDSTGAARLGIRRMITAADVGDFTTVGQDGEKHHYYVDSGTIRVDRATATGKTLAGAQQTGTIFGFAIDWDTGNFWISRNNVWNSGGGDPSNLTGEVDTLDRNTNWAAHVWNAGSAGNSVIRLKSHTGEMTYAPPTGFVAWVDQGTIEAGGNGVTARAQMQKATGAQVDREYLWEGTTTTYLYDDNDTDSRFPLVEGVGAPTNRVLGGTQLSYASVDSVTWGRSTNEPYVRNSAAISIGNAAHAWELWYRQPDFSQTVSTLMGGTLNNNIVVGKVGAGVNTPAARNNFNSDLRWESEIDTYGDNTSHQLMEVHDGAYSANYFVTLDGMPIASGSNSGWWGINTGGNEWNGDENSGDGSSASGGDFGSYTQYRGGKVFTLYDVRRLFEASALDGHDMLSFPRWCTLDSSNVTVQGTGDKDAALGVVLNDTGIRSYAIPRNGKVYWEMEIVSQGDGTAVAKVGIRKLAEPNPVGTWPGVADSSYNADGIGNVEDGTQSDITTTGTLGTHATGRIIQFAIDWDTGNWWIGTDNTVWLGIGGAGDPGTGANPLTTLDINTNWAASVWNTDINGFGNGTVRLVTASGDLNFSLPTGFSAWEDAD